MLRNVTGQYISGTLSTFGLWAKIRDPGASRDLAFDLHEWEGIYRPFNIRLDQIMNWEYNLIRWNLLLPILGK